MNIDRKVAQSNFKLKHNAYICLASCFICFQLLASFFILLSCIVTGVQKYIPGDIFHGSNLHMGYCLPPRDYMENGKWEMGGGGVGEVHNSQPA